MFDRIVHQAQDAAARTARKAVLGLGAVLCLAAGTAFLTAAAWLYLVSITTPLIAAAIIGGAYCGVGFVLLGVAAASGGSSKTPEPSHSSAAHAEGENMGPKIVEAFMTGLQAGRRART